MSDQSKIDKTPDNAAGVMAFKPTRTQRFWLALGFCWTIGAEPVGADKMEGWMRTDIGMHFGFMDRLRLLLTGRLRIHLTQHLPVRCDFSRNRMDWRIVPPGEIR